MLIELQGSLEVELNHPSERNGRLVGTLKIDEATVSNIIEYISRCGFFTRVLSLSISAANSVFSRIVSLGIDLTASFLG